MDSFLHFPDMCPANLELLSVSERNFFVLKLDNMFDIYDVTSFNTNKLFRIQLQENLLQSLSYRDFPVLKYKDSVLIIDVYKRQRSYSPVEKKS